MIRFTQFGTVRQHLALFVILLLALALRLAYAVQASGTPLADVLLLDSEFYDRQARSLGAGSGWTEGVFFMNPLYPYLLASLYWVAGPSWGVVVGVQVMLGVASCGMVYGVGRLTWDPAAGLLGAAFCAVCGVLVFYDGALLTATPILFFNLAGLYLLLRWRAQQRARWLCLAGFCLGVSALARPLVLIWVLLLGGWFTAHRQARAWVILLLGVGLVLAPAVARNWLVGGELALTTSSAGMNFYVGNHPQATGIYSQVAFVPSAEPDQERIGFMREAERRRGEATTPASASAFWLAEGLRFIRQEPGAYLQLTWRKFALFWNEVEAQNNLSYYFAREWVPFLHLLPGWGLLAPLGLVGFGLAWGRREVLLDLYVLAYLLGCLLFFVSSEYRLPVVPVLALWAGQGLIEAHRAWLDRRWGRMAAAGAALVSIALGVHHRDPLVERLQSMRVDYHNFAVLYERKGDLGRARDLAQRSLAIDPGFVPAQQTLARLENRVSLPGGGGNEAEVARGLALFGAGDFRAAAEVFAGLVARYPGQGPYHNSLGLCLYRLGEYTQAEEQYLLALALDPEYAVAHYNLGLLQVASGQPEAGIAEFRLTLELDPQYKPARFKLGEVLARQGDHEAALAVWEVLLEAVRGDLVLQAKMDSLKGVAGREAR